MVVPFVYTEEEYKKLEEENKFLKAEIELLKKPRFSDRYFKKLEEENIKLKEELSKFSEAYKRYRDYEKEELAESCYDFSRDNDRLKQNAMEDTKRITELEEENRKLKERIDILYEFIERNDKLVDEVIDEEDLDKLNRYIYIDDDLVDKALESED